MLFYIKYKYDIISLQVDCIKQMLELCMNIQNINNKSNLIRNLKFRVKRLDITTQQHIACRQYAQTFINMM